MRSRLLAWTATVVLLSLTGAGTAMADDAAPGQAVGQTAASQQTADADASSTQVQPTNQNISVRVLSPGDSGAVSQSNESAAAAAAANANATQQAASQDASGAGTQAVGQEAQSTQAAEADAQSEQIKPTNRNISVRVLSEGDDGSVEQENTSSAGALAANANKTAQVAEQAAAGGEGDDGGGTQAVAQKAKSKQDADADATSVQDHPSNVNVPVRVLSDGDGGDVEQENSSTAKSAALNANHTLQKAAQDQGDGGGYAPKDRHDEGCGCESASGAAIQAIGQKADNRQEADADARSKQIGAKNVNAPVRVLSSGDDGRVSQSNDSFAGAVAANKNATGQFAQQAQGESGHGAVGIQAIGQLARSDQEADADATSLQIGAKNVNAPVRILSGGDDGDVDQRNRSFAGALALNANATKQVARQDMGGGYGPVAIQAIGQAAFNRQDADADASSVQLRPANVNAPVDLGHGKKHDSAGHEEGKDEHSARHGDDKGHQPTAKGSRKGGDGSVEQANDSAALAAGLNGNRTGQLAFAV